MNTLNGMKHPEESTEHPEPSEEPTELPQGSRDPAAVAQLIERFAAALVDLGFPRMPARVFAALVTTDSGRLTAAELAERLDISPGAVSGAVRYLSRIDLITRERLPGSRRDQYVLFDDVWYKATLTKDQRMQRLTGRLRAGVSVLGSHTSAGLRLAETLSFFEFVQRELDLMLDRWETHRATTAPGGGHGPSAGSASLAARE